MRLGSGILSIFQRRGRPSEPASSAWPNRPPLWYLALVLLLFVPTTFAERSFTAGANQSLWTPALGMVFGLMVLFGVRWVPILVGALVGVTAIESVGKSVDWSVVTALLAVVVAGYGSGALLARACRVRWSLRRLSDALVLSTSALAGTAVAIAGALGVVDAYGLLGGRDAWTAFWQGCASAGASTLAVAPLVLIAGEAAAGWDLRRKAGQRSTHQPLERGGDREPQRRSVGVRTAARAGEAALQAGTFAAAANLGITQHNDPRYYPMLIPLGWLALRRGILGTSIGVAMGTTSLSLFAHSYGLVASEVNGLEVFLLVFALCGICFGAAQTERMDYEHEVVESRRAVAESEATLRLLIESSGDQAICMLDCDGQVLTWNAVAERLTGYPREDAVGRNAAVFHDAPSETAHLELKEMLVEAADRGECRREQTRRRRDGSTYLASVLITPMRREGRLIGYAEIVQDITATRAAWKLLHEKVNRDPETMLPLRGMFQEHLVKAQDRILRSGRILAVMYMDLNELKQINDTYDHDTGDQVIRLVADRIRKAVRPLDTVARVYQTGDEFLVLCDDLSSREEAWRIASRVREAVANPLEIPGRGDLHLTTSLGISFAGPFDDPAEVIADAEAAMKQDKQGWRAAGTKAR